LAVGSVELGDLAPIADRDACAFELVDQIVGHRLAQVGTTVEQGDECSAAREPYGGLPGRIAAADDGDPRRARKLCLRRAGGVEDTQPLELGEVVERQLPVVGAGREDDGARDDRVIVLEMDEVATVVPGLERQGAVWRGRSSAELSRLDNRPARQVSASDAGREAEVVLDAARR